MTDEDEKQPKGDVGYGRPPVEHQFRKGKSGNPKGRRKKSARLMAPRQVRRDILSITEAPTTIQTASGPITVPTHVAVLMVARKKALSGHGPSIRLVLDRHNAAIAAHWDLDNLDHQSDFPTSLRQEVPYSYRREDEEEVAKQTRKRRR